MHVKYKKADQLSGKIIGAAIEVHKHKGPGLLESIYEKCLVHELQLRQIPVKNQLEVPIEYRGLLFEESLKLDVLVDDCLIVEIKAVEHILPIHKAQLLTYMKLLDMPIGLLINFHEVILKKGISRMILPGSNLN